MKGWMRSGRGLEQHRRDPTSVGCGTSTAGSLAGGTPEAMGPQDDFPVRKEPFVEILDRPRCPFRDRKLQHLVEITVVESAVPRH